MSNHALAKIGDRHFLVDVPATTWRPLPSVREQVDQGAEPGEESLGNQGIWYRSADDWILGAGQELFDEPEESTRLRFKASRGIDPWTRRKLQLLPDARLVHQVSTSAEVYDIEAVGTRLYWSADSGPGKLYFSSDPEAASPTISSINPSESTTEIERITSLAGKVYFSDEANVYVADVGSTSYSVFSTTEAPWVLIAANGRLIGADENVLYEYDSGGTATTIFTAGTDRRWVAACESPIGILLVLDHAEADYSEVYLLQVLDATGALSVPFYVGSTPRGEEINDILYYGGVVVLGTTGGIRVAQVSSGGGLIIGPLIEEPGEDTTVPPAGVTSLAAHGRHVWFNWVNYEDRYQGVGRLDLSRFIEPLVPIFATDVMFDFGGVTTGSLGPVAIFEGRVYFGFFSGGNANTGLWGADSDLIAAGEITSGRITFGITELKGLTRLEAHFEPLPAGASVEGYVIDEDGTEHLVFDEGRTGSKVGEGDIENLNVDECEVKLVLNRATVATQGPVVHRWTLRAVPLPYRADEIILAVLLNDTVEEDGLVSHQDPMADWLYLKELEKSRARVDLHIGDYHVTTYVEAIAAGEGDLQDWSGDRRFFEGRWLVRLLTVESDG